VNLVGGARRLTRRRNEEKDEQDPETERTGKAQAPLRRNRSAKSSLPP
jgi:hypothetical protein